MAKQNKLISCKYCNQEIASTVKKCPYCGGKNKKPIYKRVWFWILVSFAFVSIVGSIGDYKNASTEGEKVEEVFTTEKNDSANEQSTKNNENADKENEKDTNKDTSTKTSSDKNIEKSINNGEETRIYKVGDIIQDGDMKIVYISSGYYDEDNDYMQPSDGNKYIYLKFAFSNMSANDDNSISFYNFECYADGYAVDAYYGGEDELSATLSAGRSTEGYIYFEIPTDAKEIEIEYETNWITEEKIIFAFEGDVDSGYSVDKNTIPTDGALEVGELLEGKTINIKYLACYEDTSYSEYNTPKEGYAYITCELEFENVSDSDVSVTYFSFDCYADGMDCDEKFFRDDAISATLSAGRKAKGSVTFEIPIDATIIEVEYLTNFWTSNRVVFNASKY